MNECSYQLPLTSEQESSLGLDCDGADYGLHPCCPGSNAMNRVMGGYPTSRVDAVSTEALNFFQNNGGIAILGAALIALVISQFTKR